VILPTHDDIALDVVLDGRESGRTQKIFVSDVSPPPPAATIGKKSQWKCLRQERRNIGAPNNPTRPPDASRNAKVSTPASVIGTSAKDLLGNQYDSSTDTTTGGRRAKQPAILSEDVRTDLDCIEVRGHFHRGISCRLKASDGRLTTRTVRSFPIWEADPTSLLFSPLSSCRTPMLRSSQSVFTTRQRFWDHVHEQLIHLLTDQRVWVRRFPQFYSISPLTFFHLCHCPVIPFACLGVGIPNVFRSRTLPTPRL